MDVDHWLPRLAAELGLTDVELTPDVIATLLDVARDAAHGVERRSAPLTTFLLGVAVGRGADLPTAASATADLLAQIPPQPAND